MNSVDKYWLHSFFFCFYKQIATESWWHNFMMRNEHVDTSFSLDMHFAEIQPSSADKKRANSN